MTVDGIKNYWGYQL